MTWKEVQAEMSIAGDPELAVKFGQDVHELAVQSMNTKNIPSVENQILALERVIAELRHWSRTLRSRQSITSNEI